MWHVSKAKFQLQNVNSKHLLNEFQEGKVFEHKFPSVLLFP
jgi:hypothetical protein